MRPIFLSLLRPNSNCIYKNDTQEGTCVVLLGFEEKKGRHMYFMAKDCWRITPEELKELYNLSQVGAAGGERMPTHRP